MIFYYFQRPSLKFRKGSGEVNEWNIFGGVELVVDLVFKRVEENCQKQNSNNFLRAIVFLSPEQ